MNLKLLFILLLTILTNLNIAFGESGPDNISPSHHQHEQKHFELEVSLTDEAHVEFTGAVYFFRENKIQLTADQSGHHFASVLVHEIPFHHSHWGTFFGAGMNFGFDHEEDSDPILGAHKPVTTQPVGHHIHWEKALLIQSGIAYNIDEHWSTGVTLSPAYDMTMHQPDFAMTFDLVFGF